MLLSLSACNNAADNAKNVWSSSSSESMKRDIRGGVIEFTKSIAVDTTSASSYIGSGSVKLATGDSQGAIADLTKAIKLDPNSANAYSGRAAARFAKGDIPGAIADILNAARIIVFAKPGNG